MTDEASWNAMQAEIDRQLQARLALFRSEGKTLYQVAIDTHHDTTTGDAPEFWCIVKTDTDEVVQERMSQADVIAFVSTHPDCVDIWSVDDEIRDQVREGWEN